jgi:negative regulator of flagellin synthesis FlgM
MSNIDPTRNRTSFFPNSKTSQNSGLKNIQQNILQRNDFKRKSELDSTTQKDSKVKIPDAVRDFSRIKKAVDMAKAPDNSSKIEALKAQIQNGTYKVDYEAVADKLLQSEF